MVIVKEHIYEKFEQDSDPIKDMKIGVEHHSFHLHHALIFYTTSNNKIENRKWLEAAQIIEYLKNPNKEFYQFGRKYVKYFIKDTYFFGFREGEMYGSFYELISDNYYYIKYLNKYYEIKVNDESQTYK